MTESPSSIRYITLEDFTDGKENEAKRTGVVVQQPTHVNPQGGVLTVGHNMMLTPFQRIPNYLPGLEYLNTAEQLLVHQKVELLEVFTGCQTQNEYTVKNVFGKTVFLAKESSGCCARQLCLNLRAFDMQIFDNSGNEVIHLNRPLNCTGCFFPGCLQIYWSIDLQAAIFLSGNSSIDGGHFSTNKVKKMEISSPPGTLIGFIQEEWSICTHKYNVMDVLGNVIFYIEKHSCSCHCNCCSDIDYEVSVSGSEQQVGKITKHWGGLLKEVFTNADNFSVTFPKDLDVKMKAILLGASIFIDFLHFEKKFRKLEFGLAAMATCLHLL